MRRSRTTRPPDPAAAPRRLLAALIVIATLASACASADAPARPDAPGSTPDADALQVVTTTTVFADLIRQVGGTRVAVHSLVPRGGEVHTFDPTPSDARRVTEAGLIVVNGLGLDDWLANLVADLGSEATVIELGVDLAGVTYIEGGARAASGGGATDPQGVGDVNPHLWMDVAYASRYVDRIAAALTQADPGDAAAYDAGAAAYRARLAELDAWVETQLSSVPEADRRIVSFHDAFPYYAAAYGLEVVGTIVDAPGQDPSAGEVADLVGAIREDGVVAILSEAQFSDELARTIADETGARVVSDLYTDTLGDPPVDTYEGLIRWDTERIVAALR